MVKPDDQLDLTEAVSIAVFYEPLHEKMYLLICAPNKNSNQPVHPFNFLGNPHTPSWRKTLIGALGSSNGFPQSVLW